MSVIGRAVQRCRETRHLDKSDKIWQSPWASPVGVRAIALDGDWTFKMLNVGAEFETKGRIVG